MNASKNINQNNQTHKKEIPSYKINPSLIPRPNSLNEYYQNELKLPIFKTKVELIPPFASSYFNVVEEDNSSCRYIRASNINIPNSQEKINMTGLHFGLCINPFPFEPKEEKDKIPKINLAKNEKNKIFRCKNCECYVNNKFSYFEDAKKTLNSDNISALNNMYCNICKSNNDISKSLIRIEEKTRPTIEYIIKDNLKEVHYNYIIAIDFTLLSYESNFGIYVLNSIQNNLNYFYNPEYSYIGIITFGKGYINYFYYERKFVKCMVVTDLNDKTFTPFNKNNFLLNVKNDQDKILKIIEAIKSSYLDSDIYYKRFTINSLYADTFPVFYSALNSITNNKSPEECGRILLFNTNPFINTCNLDEIINKSKLNKIVIDQFNLIDLSFNKSSFHTEANYNLYFKEYLKLSNETGGKFHIYKANNPLMNSLLFNYQKMHYDITQIISNENFYGCKFMIRYSQSIENFEILSNFEKKTGDAFEIPGCDNEFSFTYFFRIKKMVELNDNEKLHFQIAYIFTNNSNQEILKILNYTIQSTIDMSKVYNYYDIDAITKLTLLKEITYNLNNSYEELFNKIFQSFMCYRKSSSSTSASQLVFPSSLKYYPIYIHSFLYKQKLYSDSNNFYLIELYNYILRSPVEKLSFYLYPSLYRIDDIENDQKYNASNIVDQNIIKKDIGLLNKFEVFQKPYMLRLSLDSIDLDSAYMINDGIFINMFVFDNINTTFYEKVFGYRNFNECMLNKTFEINENCKNELNNRIKNIIEQMRKDNFDHKQIVKIIFMNKDNLKTQPELLQFLMEDGLEGINNYVDFLYTLHKKIKKELKALKGV